MNWTGPVWYVQHGMTDADLEARKATLLKDGYTLFRVSSAKQNGQQFHIALWIRGKTSTAPAK